MKLLCINALHAKAPLQAGKVYEQAGERTCPSCSTRYVQVEGAFTPADIVGLPLRFRCARCGKRSPVELVPALAWLYRHRFIPWRPDENREKEVATDENREVA